MVVATVVVMDIQQPMYEHLQPTLSWRDRQVHFSQLYIGMLPLSVTVTTRICAFFCRGSRTKPSLAPVTGKGSIPKES